MLIKLNVIEIYTLNKIGYSLLLLEVEKQIRCSIIY